MSFAISFMSLCAFLQSPSGIWVGPVYYKFRKGWPMFVLHAFPDHTQRFRNRPCTLDCKGFSQQGDRGYERYMLRDRKIDITGFRSLLSWFVLISRHLHMEYPKVISHRVWSVPGRYISLVLHEHPKVGLLCRARYHRGCRDNCPCSASRFHFPLTVI
jgi:hypothetical protein